MAVPLLAFALAAADPAAFFEEKVRPLLAARCIGCHGDARVSGLRLDSREGMLAGGRLGPAIRPGDASASLLVQAITHTHAKLKMPPGERLAEPEAAALRQWIAAGAVWPERRAVQSISGKITAEHRNWWAFAPIRAVAPPDAPGSTAIDRFLAAKQAEASVKANPPATRLTLIRRVTHDLTGLPPTPAEVDSFLADPAPDAFRRVVDRLLDSPRFGERWARHWLDVARYAEDDVLGLSQQRYPNAWRYRDWVIEAFNRDLPYDEFIKAQIAADQLPPNPAFDLRPALGFLGLGPWHYSVSPPPQARADERHDRIDTISRGVLGLTVACARCHDHKFDPVTTRDYYALAGVFASTEYQEIPLAGPAVVERFEKHQQRISAQRAKIKRYLDQQREQLGEIFFQQTPRFIAAARGESAADGLDAAVLERWRGLFAKPMPEHPLWRLATAQLVKLCPEVVDERRQIEAEKKAAVDRPRPPKGASKTRLPNNFESYDDFCPGCDVAVRAQERDRFLLWGDLFREGSDDKPGGVYWFSDKQVEGYLTGEWKTHLERLRAELAELERSAPEAYPFLHAVGDKERPYDLRIARRGDPYTLGDEQPRRFLEVLTEGEPARWTRASGRLELAEALMRQPVAARVAANRVWMHLFGRALVNSPSNFGRFGDRPTHPDLLEHLAARLVASGWRVKSLIRELVLTDAYQRSSDALTANEAIDAANKWHWRMNRRRRDAESIHDAMLAVSGRLEPKLGGAPADLDADFTRRAIYARISRFKLAEPLLLFDFPNPAITAERRNVTHVPLQRLYFLNNGFVARQADALAKRVEGPDALTSAWRLLHGRAPNAAERALAADFLAGGTWPRFAQALLSSNEFLFVD